MRFKLYCLISVDEPLIPVYIGITGKNIEAQRDEHWHGRFCDVNKLKKTWLLKQKRKIDVMLISMHDSYEEATQNQKEIIETLKKSGHLLLNDENYLNKRIFTKKQDLEHHSILNLFDELSG